MFCACNFGSLSAWLFEGDICCFAGDQAGTIILLISNSADVHSRSAVGDSALHVAAAQGNVAAINALLSQVCVSTSSTHANAQL